MSINSCKDMAGKYKRKIKRGLRNEEIQRNILRRLSRLFHLRQAGLQLRQDHASAVQGAKGDVDGMNEQEKSLALAKLMGWRTQGCICWLPYEVKAAYRPYGSESNTAEVQPYKDNEVGLAQFAAILLKFPEVMHELSGYDDHPEHGGVGENFFNEPPTQANILDEILRMNGVEI